MFQALWFVVPCTGFRAAASFCGLQTGFEFVGIRDGATANGRYREGEAGSRTQRVGAEGKVCAVGPCRHAVSVHNTVGTREDHGAMTAPTVEAAINDLMDRAWNVVYHLLAERGLLGDGLDVEEYTGIHSWGTATPATRSSTPGL
jgi:hypothetical protein